MQTAKQRKQKERDTRAAEGWVYFRAWIRPQWAKRIKALIAKLGE